MKKQDITTLGFQAIQKYLSTQYEKNDNAIYSRVASGITLSLSSSSILPGDTAKIEVHVEPTIANIPNLMWLSSDPNIVSVDGDGNIVAYENGDVTISAIDTVNSGLSATLPIHVGSGEETLRALKFIAAEDSTLSLTRVGTSNPNIEYSLSGESDWMELNETIEIPSGESVYVRGNNPAGIGLSSEDYSYFVMTGSIACEGNIMHLISHTQDLSTVPGTYCFYKLFSGCSSLTSAPELPATILSDYCYDGLFYECTGLSYTPELPSVSLSNFCYREMFYGCTSLIEAPDLPATIVPVGCYVNMFYNCQSLEKAPTILPAPLLSEFCYTGMFYKCSILETAPELPALGLVENCYNNMFLGCSRLNQIKALFTSTPGEATTMDWVEGVATSGTFIKNSAATWNVTSKDGIPEGWTVETA